MIEPIGNRVFVILDNTIPTEIDGLIIPPDTDRWRGKDNAVESMNRGKVAFVGPDVYGVEPGEYVRFSEIVYPTTEYQGQKYTVITDMDIVGVEEEGSFKVAEAA